MRAIYLMSPKGVSLVAVLFSIIVTTALPHCSDAFYHKVPRYGTLNAQTNGPMSEKNQTTNAKEPS
jgi:hypothetical protein